jgi:tetratricopeptide (TPR) repeat protein
MSSSNLHESDRATFALLETLGGEAQLPSELDVLLAEGRGWIAAGRLPLAELYLRRSIQLARRRHDAETMGEASLLLAYALIGQSKAREAISVLRSLLDVPLSVDGSVRWNLLMGHLLMEFCRYDLADEYYRRALRLEGAPGFRLGEAHIERAGLLAMQGHSEPAEKEFLAGRRIFEELDEIGERAAIAVVNEGLFHLQCGSLDRGIEPLERFRAIPVVSRNLRLSTMIEVGLAEGALLTGDLELARALDEVGEEGARRAGMDAVEAQILIHRTAMDEGDPETRIIELDATARRLHVQGQLEESARLWSMAAVVAGQRGLPAEPHRQRMHLILAGRTATIVDAYNARLLEAARRPRPGRLRVRWNGAGPTLHLPASAATRDGEDIHVGDLEAAVFVADAEMASLMRKRLWGFRRLLTFNDWRKFERVAASMNVAVVALPSLADAGDRRALVELKSRAPLLPVVLVTRREADAPDSLTELHVDEVVWVGQVERDLRAASVRAASRTLLRWLAQSLARADHLPSKLREALVYACRTTRPVRSVTVLAEAVERHRTTLGRMWRDAVGEELLRLEDFLAWLLLLRAVARRPRGMSWAAVADELDVHEQTLRETSRRLVGRRLDELADASGQAWLVEQFARQVLDPLLGASRIKSR